MAAKLDHLQFFELKHYQFATLKIESQNLKSNPLKDTNIRYNPILVPKRPSAKSKVIFVLSGFASDGSKNFSFNRFDNNFVQELDLWTEEEQITSSYFVFVNAWTTFGGSQFINSLGAGLYEDYIIKELVPAFKKAFLNNNASLLNTKNWIVFGGSSGGYGALHLGSKYPEIFGHIVSLAPDSFFELSLLPEVYKYLPYLKSVGGIKGLKEKLSQGLIKWSHDIFFGVMNLVAMTSCYAPLDLKSELQFKFPINELGVLDQSIWSEWLKYDPIQFLPERCENLKKLASILIYTGDKDEHGLQYGSRQINHLLNSMKVKNTYVELSGTHRSLSQFKKQALTEIF